MDADGVRLIADIAADAEAADGTSPLDEAAWLALRHRSDDLEGHVTGDGFVLLIGDELSLVVRPGARGKGVGGSLLEALLPAYDGALRAWSHVDHPAAARLAERHGFTKVRELWVMRRRAAEPAGEVSLPEGVAIRGYHQRDEEQLLRINAAAFATHPEQGKMTAEDLAERMAEPWFDPSGLLVAVDEGRLLGFHWTKAHSAEVGEVYVVGIDPSAQGMGLGRALTRAGLAHLAERGITEVLLYVEADNAPAIRLYQGLGFVHEARDTHVMYQRG
ncbi:mycothiol synthase [Nocardioides coralli]|uniref:mycothiol synthase n=1 Tax=Nocardioides coralli TaxID=2872154 RepID=UPI001CA3FC3A|nr:mycothiol synthase [Nocardioides coralli]QZY28808.1 mycothiol synthase [Nocardioides coralli]